MSPLLARLIVVLVGTIVLVNEAVRLHTGAARAPSLVAITLCLIVLIAALYSLSRLSLAL